MSTRKSQEDRQIENLKESLNSGDNLIVTDLDRLGRDMGDLIALMNYFMDKGVKVYFVTDTMLNPSGDDLMDKLKISIVAFFAEVERRRISRRTKSALQGLKKKGVKLGHKKEFLKSMYDDYEETIYQFKESANLSFEKICLLIDIKKDLGFKSQSMRTWFNKRYELEPNFGTFQKTKKYIKHLEDN